MTFDIQITSKAGAAPKPSRSARERPPGRRAPREHAPPRAVLDALEQLPEAQRLPIVLVALREMSYADAARTLDVPLGTFYSRLARGREALRRIVGGMKSTRLKLVV